MRIWVKQALHVPSIVSFGTSRSTGLHQDGTETAGTAPRGQARIVRQAAIRSSKRMSFLWPAGPAHGITKSGCSSPSLPDWPEGLVVMGIEFELARRLSAWMQQPARPSERCMCRTPSRPGTGRPLPLLGWCTLIRTANAGRSLPLPRGSTRNSDSQRYSKEPLSLVDTAHGRQYTSPKHK